MSPVEDDPVVWGALCKIWRTIADSLAFTAPFIGPAFIGALLSASRKSYRKKGVVYWFSAVTWSTAAGAVLTPLFAHVMSFSDDVARSSAALLAILGHEGVGLIFRKAGFQEEAEQWDGVERRKTTETANPEPIGRERDNAPPLQIRNRVPGKDGVPRKSHIPRKGRTLG